MGKLTVWFTGSLGVVRDNPHQWFASSMTSRSGSRTQNSLNLFKKPSSQNTNSCTVSPLEIISTFRHIFTDSFSVYHTASSKTASAYHPASASQPTNFYLNPASTFTQLPPSTNFNQLPNHIHKHGWLCLARCSRCPQCAVCILPHCASMSCC